ncbi:MAG TPA: hypothetical protein VKY42_11810, partial [Trueperaceae bacterium]|nr:hypothetical protein [Trueperaceae bacterium]
QGARSFTLSDDRAALGFATETLVEQFGMMSGLSGDVDFEAVEAASAALAEFLAFATERFGGSVSYSTVDGPVVRSEGFSFVEW